MCNYLERFFGKVAVVTGSASGIGLATSKRLIEAGMVVVGLDMEDENLKEVCATLNTNTESKKFLWQVCDVRRQSDIDRTFQWVREHVGQIWVLVNCAGVLPRTTLLDASEADISKTLDTNVKGLLMCAQKAAKLMIEDLVPGHIININSINGHYIRNSPNADSAKTMIYAASKHAVTVLTEGLRREMIKRDVMIKFSSISPGGVHTELSRDSRAESSKFNAKSQLMPDSVARACISVLNTSPTELVSELTIMAIQQQI